MVFSLVILLLATIVWMAFASLNISVHAMGSVVPSSKIQHIQSLEGGIIRDIAVKEGQQVKRGDLLAYIENLQYDSELAENITSRLTAEAGVERLKAELQGRAPEFTPQMENKIPEIVAEQRNLALSRQGELQATITTIENQILSVSKSCPKPSHGWALPAACWPPPKKPWR